MHWLHSYAHVFIRRKYFEFVGNRHICFMLQSHEHCIIWAQVINKNGYIGLVYPQKYFLQVLIQKKLAKNASATQKWY